MNGVYVGLPISKGGVSGKVNPCSLLGHVDKQVPLPFSELKTLVEDMYEEKELESVDWGAFTLLRMTDIKHQTSDLKAKGNPMYMFKMVPVKSCFHMPHSGELTVSLVPTEMVDRGHSRTSGSGMEQGRMQALGISKLANQIFLDRNRKSKDVPLWVNCFEFNPAEGMHHDEKVAIYKALLNLAADKSLKPKHDWKTHPEEARLAMNKFLDNFTSCSDKVAAVSELGLNIRMIGSAVASSSSCSSSSSTGQAHTGESSLARFRIKKNDSLEQDVSMEGVRRNLTTLKDGEQLKIQVQTACGKGSKFGANTWLALLDVGSLATHPIQYYFKVSPPVGLDERIVPLSSNIRSSYFETKDIDLDEDAIELDES